MTFEFSTNSLDKISSDALIVFAFQKNSGKEKTYIPLKHFQYLDSVLKGVLKKFADLEQFSGKRGEIAKFIPSSDLVASRIFIIGLGAKKDFKSNDLRRAIGIFASKAKKSIDSAVLSIPTSDEIGIGLSEAAQVVIEGFLLGSYEFGKYKSEKGGDREFSTIVISETDLQRTKQIKDAIKQAELFSQATILARDLINEPPSVVTPTSLADLAKDIARKNSQISCKVFDKAECEKMGMEAFLGIARGADTPPKFIHLEYTPKTGKTKEKLALVGKGITFDSGGISLKPADSMTTMKCDMSGAAAVLGIFSVITHLQPSISVIGLIAATPNLVSGTSIVPGDIVKAYNGKTIEILNTDAEGRVTMADSLSYAVKQNATKIIDFATLTGACMVALGRDITGLFSNNQDLTNEVKKAAQSAGENVWELPLPKDYQALNKSDVADIANIPNTRYGGAITAGLFLQEFVGNTPWVHLDIAGPAFIEHSSDLGPKGGSGFGVRTILNLLSR